ncbi:MAG: helix-turn-helix transcriptional regulator, partial [Hyphococcus sp.]
MTMDCFLSPEGPALALTSLPPGAAARASRNQAALLFVVLKGECVLETSDRTLRIAESYAAFLPTDAAYAWRIGDHSALAAIISLDHAGYAEMLSMKHGYAPYRLEDSPSYYLISQIISKAINGRQPQGMADDILALSQLLARRRADDARTADGRIGAVVNRIHDEPLVLSSLACFADMTGMHPMTLARKFRQACGCSIGEFRQRVRAERAFYRLIKAAAPLSTLSLDCGYSDQSHMTRTFRRYFGFTPAHLR